MDWKRLEEFYKGKRVLVTGHTGFKGSWLCRILTLAGAEVTGYSLNPPTDPSLFEIAGIGTGLTSVIGDVRDLEHLEKAFEEARPEIVFHLAAQPIVRDSYKDPVYTYETNVMGTVHVLECIRETDPLDGYDPYSNSKSCSELVTHSYQKSFFQDRSCAISTARAGNVIGGGDFANDRIIPDCVRGMKERKPIGVRNPHSTRPFQLVLEPLAVYLTIAMAQWEDPSVQGYYNVGPDDCDCVTTGELVDLFCQYWGEGARWENHFAGGPHEANFLKLDCSRVKKTFGWKPNTGIRQAVEWSVLWYKAWLAGEDMTEATDRQIKEFFKYDR